MSQIKVSENVMKDIFILQGNLVKLYSDRGDFKMPPLELELKSTQQLLRDFSYYFIEETGEAFEELYKAHEFVKVNDMDAAKLCVKNFNVEIADSNHFFTELLIFSGMDIELFSITIKEFLDSVGLAYFFDENAPLKSLYKYTDFTHKEEFDTIKRRSFINFRAYSKKETLDMPEIAGGNLLSQQMVDAHGQILWEVSYKLTKAMNCLKNKHWTQTERKVNTALFYERITAFIIAWVKYLYFADITEIPLFTSYSLKNQINLERIKNSY